ncbi:hypothetical protein [Paraclostridium sordellii]|uniref:hypothetical protein n=1 Tax=Paraclostridium sordellii TaxID=1505 RepID=UPI000E503C26|nr:hypothetical protein [Paeniclostridium sordellii]RGX10544.1 hypothetical protein DWV40_06150 [Paeniclostridium sordellii]
MAGFIAKQPNGLYCRFSAIVDCPTHYNMTFEDYINAIKESGYNYETAVKEAKEVIEYHLKPFEEVIERFVPNNMSEEAFKEWLKLVGYKDKIK